MDVQQSWKNLLDAWSESNWTDVIPLADSLIAWLDDGGFPPDLEYRPGMGPDFDRVVMRAACELVSRRAASLLDDPRHLPQDVPFTLTCWNCNNEGPYSEEEAGREGWCGITYVPTSLSENFLGLCPICRVDDS